MNKRSLLILSIVCMQLQAKEIVGDIFTEKPYAEYAYIYSETAQQVDINADIIFDSNGPMSNGIIHRENSSEILFKKAGVYQVSFFTSHGGFALFLNDTLVNGSVYSDKSDGPALNKQVIVKVNASDKLTIRNYHPINQSKRSLSVASESQFGKYPLVTASIMITQII